MAGPTAGSCSFAQRSPIESCTPVSSRKRAEASAVSPSRPSTSDLAHRVSNPAASGEARRPGWRRRQQSQVEQRRWLQPNEHEERTHKSAHIRTRRTLVAPEATHPEALALGAAGEGGGLDLDEDGNLRPSVRQRVERVLDRPLRRQRVQLRCEEDEHNAQRPSSAPYPRGFRFPSLRLRDRPAPSVRARGRPARDRREPRRPTSASCRQRPAT